MNPQIISSYDGGRHNVDLDKTVSRLEKNAAYKDLSTVIIIPALGSIPTKAVASWWNMYTPPNQKCAKLFAVGMEVGEAYSRTIESILAHPDLKNWKYVLTLEHDNVPPPDGLIKLLERAEANPDFSAIGGLYFTKGEGGVAQIWGNVTEFPLNFKPQRPVQDALVECNGTGMGFTLFRMSMFKDERLRKPWFRTTADTQNGMFTQDLYAWTDFKKHGYRCAIDCSVRVGHYDQTQDITW
jgi:hypothetical protein